MKFAIHFAKLDLTISGLDLAEGVYGIYPEGDHTAYHVKKCLHFVFDHTELPERYRSMFQEGWCKVMHVDPAVLTEFVSRLWKSNPDLFRVDGSAAYIDDRTVGFGLLYWSELQRSLRDELPINDMLNDTIEEIESILLRYTESLVEVSLIKKQIAE